MASVLQLQRRGPRRDGSLLQSEHSSAFVTATLHAARCTLTEETEEEEGGGQEAAGCQELDQTRNKNVTECSDHQDGEDRTPLRAIVRELTSRDRPVQPPAMNPSLRFSCRSCQSLHAASRCVFPPPQELSWKPEGMQGIKRLVMK
eukprot:superscaffoldBa00012108_g25520